MFRAALARLREWIAVEDPDERIRGPGDVVLDPAYNGRYEAERELKRLANLEESEAEAEAEVESGAEAPRDTEP